MNKQIYYYYCPLCGCPYDDSLYKKYPNRCIICMKDVAIQKSQRTIDEYFEMSKEKYGDTSHAMKIFEEEELYKDTNLKNHLEEIRAVEQRNIIRKTMNNSAHNATYNSPNTPKCPTCSSTNIKPVSGLKRGLHGYLFGIFSATSLAQFECKDCGYKW